MAEAQQTIDVDVSPEAFYAVIADVERYPEFLPAIENVRVLRREGDVVEAEFTLHLITHIDYTLQLTGTPPTGLIWTLLEGGLVANTGSWTLEPLPDGGTRAHYAVRVEVGMFVPGAILTRLVGRELPATLQAFKARAEGASA